MSADLRQLTSSCEVYTCREISKRRKKKVCRWAVSYLDPLTPLILIVLLLIARVYSRLVLVQRSTPLSICEIRSHRAVWRGAVRMLVAIRSLGGMMRLRGVTGVMWNWRITRRGQVSGKGTWQKPRRGGSCVGWRWSCSAVGASEFGWDSRFAENCQCR